VRRESENQKDGGTSVRLPLDNSLQSMVSFRSLPVAAYLSTHRKMPKDPEAPKAKVSVVVGRIFNLL